MATFEFSSHLIEICCFLDFDEIAKEVIRVSRDWFEVLNRYESVGYWIKVRYNLALKFSISEFPKIYKCTKQNKILKFSGWKTDAGCSSLEISNSFKNLWEYNATPYSNYYSLDSDLQLTKNLNCSACFEGGYKSNKDFFKSFNSDIFTMKNSQIPNKYKIRNFNQCECLTIDPLHIKTFKDYTKFKFQELGDEEFKDYPKKYIKYEVIPSKNAAIVTKVALARPFNYTGPVKYLLVIANKEFRDFEFDEFVSFNNIENIETARNIGNVVNTVSNSNFDLVEYDKRDGFYPFLWLHFKNAGFNHVEYDLVQAHCISVVNLKLIDIDDRREEWGLNNFQPNFDLLYFVLIGCEFPSIKSDDN